jgi:hypothetical protein
VPSLLRRRDCPVCGQAHNFCLTTGPIAAGQAFAFRCPVYDRPGLLRADAAGEMTRSYLPGAISLEDAPKPRSPAGCPTMRDEN